MKLEETQPIFSLRDRIFEEEDFLLPTVIRAKDSTDEYGFINFNTFDVSNGFHIYTDDEVGFILDHKRAIDVYDTGVDELPILKMYFHQGIPDTAVEVDLNNPLHEQLVWELEFLDREVGKDRKNALARIRNVAKKMGLKSHCNAAGRVVLSTDIHIVWK